MPMTVQLTSWLIMAWLMIYMYEEKNMPVGVFWIAE